jgi:hypothetical protein
MDNNRITHCVPDSHNESWLAAFKVDHAEKEKFKYKCATWGITYPDMLRYLIHLVNTKIDTLPKDFFIPEE